MIVVKRYTEKITSSTTPGSIFVRPVAKVSMIVNKERISNTVDFVSIPSVRLRFVISDTTATAGMVRTDTGKRLSLMID
jgi:hypothetical protein